jgi:hypothetical protein
LNGLSAGYRSIVELSWQIEISIHTPIPIPETNKKNPAMHKFGQRGTGAVQIEES